MDWAGGAEFVECSKLQDDVVGGRLHSGIWKQIQWCTYISFGLGVSAWELKGLFLVIVLNSTLHGDIARCRGRGHKRCWCRNGGISSFLARLEGIDGVDTEHAVSDVGHMHVQYVAEIHVMHENKE